MSKHFRGIVACATDLRNPKLFSSTQNCVLALIFIPFYSNSIAKQWKWGILALKSIFWPQFNSEFSNEVLLKFMAYVNVPLECFDNNLNKSRQFKARKLSFFHYFCSNFNTGKLQIGHFLKRPWLNHLVFNGL